MKAKLQQRLNQINPIIKKGETYWRCSHWKHTNTHWTSCRWRPGRSSACWDSSYKDTVWSKACSQWGKKKCLKEKYVEKYPHTLTLTLLHTYSNPLCSCRFLSKALWGSGFELLIREHLAFGLLSKCLWSDHFVLICVSSHKQHIIGRSSRKSGPVTTVASV